MFDQATSLHSSSDGGSGGGVAALQIMNYTESDVFLRNLPRGVNRKLTERLADVGAQANGSVFAMRLQRRPSAQLLLAAVKSRHSRLRRLGWTWLQAHHRLLCVVAHRASVEVDALVLAMLLEPVVRDTKRNF